MFVNLRATAPPEKLHHSSKTRRLSIVIIRIIILIVIDNFLENDIKKPIVRISKEELSMLKPPRPPDEEQRISSLRSLHILDTPAEERFDRITRIAIRLFQLPISLISLVDTDR